MGHSVLISSNMTDSTVDEVFAFGQVLGGVSHYISFSPSSNLLTLFSPSKESYLTMLASENVLKKDWDDPIEDEAWEDL